MNTNKYNTGIFARMYELGNIVGSGTFASVYKATSASGSVVALKRHADVDRYSLNEISILSIVDHVHIIKQIDNVYRSGEYLFQPFVFMEYNLQQYMVDKPCSIIKRKEFTDSVIEQIMQAVRYLHACRIIHRDIKITNILINPRNKQISLIDFGSAIFIGSSVQLLQSGKHVQTYTYRAPEVSMGYGNYSYPIDIWSIGMLYIEILSQGINLKEPVSLFGYPGDYIPPETVVSPPRIKPIDLIPSILQTDDVQNKLDIMLAMRPEHRISAVEYLNRYANTEGEYPDILSAMEITPAKTFHPNSQCRGEAIIWVLDFLSMPVICEPPMTSLICYAAIRLFDYYTSARDIDYASVISDKEKRNYIQAVLSCCVIIQLVVRYDRLAIDYPHIREYGMNVNTMQQLLTIEEDILECMNYKVLVVTPMDHLDSHLAKIVVLQTMHLVGNACNNTKDIANQCLAVADSFISGELSSECEAIKFTYEHNPLIQPHHNDDDLQKNLQI